MIFRPVGAGIPPWESIQPRITLDRDHFTASRYERLIDQFSVERNRRYQANRAGRGETYCNIFVWDVSRAVGAEIPHWITPEGESTAPGLGTETTANRAIEWLISKGTASGWRPAAAAEAQRLANLGRPVIATWHNPAGIGHLAVVRPGPASAEGPWLAQAGERNARRIATARAFVTAWARQEVHFFVLA